MSVNTLIVQGSFTSDGTDKTISIRSDYDKIEVENETALTQATADLAFKFTHQRGQADGGGNVWTKLGNVANDPLTVGALTAGTGFYRVDTSGAPLSAAVAITAATNITEPVFSTGSTANVSAGTVVRLSNMTGQENLNGYDFAVDTIVANTSFKMAAALATAPGAAATAGNYRIVNFERLFYPRFRFISNITQAANAVVTTTVPSGYKVGQIVRVVVPQTSQAGVSDYGMTEIDGLKGTVVAVTDTVGTQTVTLDIDSSAFTAFVFPTAAKAQASALSKAMLVPVGMDSAYAISQSQDILSDARDNRGLIGVKLVGGAASPGGASSDVMYWSAWRAESVNNE